MRKRRERIRKNEKNKATEEDHITMEEEEQITMRKTMKKVKNYCTKEQEENQGDGRTLAQEARNQTAEFRFKWGYEMPPDVLAQWIADRAQILTQYVSKRPSGVVAMILGIDDEKETPELFKCDPAGYCLGHKAASAGLKDKEAVNFLEREMKNNPSLSFPETIQMAISALQFAVKENLKATEIEVGVVRKDDPIFRLLTAAEIDEHLTAITLLAIRAEVRTEQSVGPLVF